MAEKAASEAGKEKCRKLEPSTNIFEINRMQQETDEATLVAALLAEYDVDEARASAAVTAFVQKLEANGFLA